MIAKPAKDQQPWRAHCVLGGKTSHGGPVKRCTKCGDTKLLAEFSVLRESKQRPGTFLYRPRCKECTAEDRRERYAADPGHARAQARERYPHHRDAHLVAARRSSFKRKYGITLEDYAELLQQQHGVCAACHQPETAIRNGELLRLAVDHDHADGHVRGLLCSSCNLALGHLEDSAERLKQLIYYLESGD